MIICKPKNYQFRWCRGQDLNLRTTEDWDLNPAPLTKLGNLCKSIPAPDHFLIKATGFNRPFIQPPFSSRGATPDPTR